jgi:ERCC4-type nuclease
LHVLVDDREHGGGIVKSLQEQGAVVEVARLPLGDYVVDGRLLVERKTVADLAASVCDGRLFRQARRLANHAAHRVCVVLEGTSRDAERVGVSREALQGAVISLTLIYGLPVLRSRDARETARVMIYASEQLGRVAAGLPKRALHKPTARRRVQLEMLQAIPGIGPHRACSLLDRFGGVGALASAAPREIAAVGGVGSKLAARVHWFVGERPSP